MMERISSRSNARVKWVRSLQQKKTRDESGVFVAEGIHLAQEVIKAGLTVELAVVADAAVVSNTGGTNEAVEKILGHVEKRGAPLLSVSDEILAYMAETQSPQGIILVVKTPASVDITSRNFSGGLWLVLDEVQDPGNIGTLIRSADAAGAAGVILTDGCADPYGGKALRASMGSLFHLPVLSADAQEVVTACRRGSVRLLTASGGGADVYCDVDWKRPTVLVLGNEGQGVGPVLSKQASGSVRIPIAGGAESLNVAAAGAVILFEAARQRGFLLSD